MHFTNLRSQRRSWLTRGFKLGSALLILSSFGASAFAEEAAPHAAADSAGNAVPKPATDEPAAAVSGPASAAVPMPVPVPQSEAESGVPASLLQLLPNSKYYSPYAFVVDKKARVLSVWQQTTSGLKKVAAFPADLGKNSGDKKNQGDAKTPEGIYFLQSRLDGPAIDYKLYGKRAFTTDYPNYFDRAEGKTGNGIWLHAVPDQTPLTRGSKGCVVVRNEVILNLTQYIKLGRTPVLIQNEASLVPVGELEKQTSMLNQWLESWRAAWEKKDIDGYISHYGEDFRSMKMNREQWRNYKTHLNEQYKVISVKLSHPAVFADRDRAIVRFLQEYTSDLHSDFGEKVLYLKRDAKGFRIVGEAWSEEPSQVAHEEIEASMHAAANN
jgi:murein L,D-transpeptidase YafK